MIFSDSLTEGVEKSSCLIYSILVLRSCSYRLKCFTGFKNIIVLGAVQAQLIGRSVLWARKPEIHKQHGWSERQAEVLAHTNYPVVTLSMGTTAKKLRRNLMEISHILFFWRSAVLCGWGIFGECLVLRGWWGAFGAGGLHIRVWWQRHSIRRDRKGGTSCRTAGKPRAGRKPPRAPAPAYLPRSVLALEV